MPGKRALGRYPGAVAHTGGTHRETGRRRGQRGSFERGRAL